MKSIIFILLSTIFVAQVLGQNDKVDKTESSISVSDSALNYLGFINQNNHKISTAHNAIIYGFKAKSSDSLLEVINSYQMGVDQIISNLETIDVASTISNLKNSYILWLKSISLYFNTNSHKLIEFDAANRASTQGLIENESKYKDQQLSKFFEEMEAAQTQWRSLFMLEQAQIQDLNKRELNSNK